MTSADIAFTTEEQAREAGRMIVAQIGVPPQVAVVAGSGWGSAVQAIGEAFIEFPMITLPGFSAPTVEGHAGLISGVRIGQTTAIVFQGRRHRYEFELDDYACIDSIVHNVRAAHAAGCQVIILTNAVGGLNPGYEIGQAVVIADHNDVITAAPSPLRGGPSENFLDCNALYDVALRRVAANAYFVASGKNEVMAEGVYAQVRGPHFETPAAAAYLQRNGVDLVGMSIIQEAIMAVRLGMRVLAISLVTDASGDPVTHAMVQDVVRERASHLGGLLRQIIEQI